MRWEYYPIFAHDHYGAVRYDPATYTVLIGGEGGAPWDTGATASKKGFAPRIGLAYRLGTKTVIRTGYGITIDPDNMRNQRNAFPVGAQPGFHAGEFLHVRHHVRALPKPRCAPAFPPATAPDISDRQNHAVHRPPPRPPTCRPPTLPPRSRST